jgi:hypothetical protein
VTTAADAAGELPLKKGTQKSTLKLAGRSYYFLPVTATSYAPNGVAMAWYSRRSIAPDQSAASALRRGPPGSGRSRSFARRPGVADWQTFLSAINSRSAQWLRALHPGFFISAMSGPVAIYLACRLTRRNWCSAHAAWLAYLLSLHGVSIKTRRRIVNEIFRRTLLFRVLVANDRSQLWTVNKTMNDIPWRRESEAI